MKQRMLGFKGPSQRSPMLSDAINTGYLFIEIRCAACGYQSTLNLTVIHWPKETTPLHELERRRRSNVKVNHSDQITDHTQCPQHNSITNSPTLGTSIRLNVIAPMWSSFRGSGSARIIAAFAIIKFDGFERDGLIIASGEVQSE